VNYETHQKVKQHIKGTAHQKASAEKLIGEAHQKTLAQAIRKEQAEPDALLPTTVAPEHLAYIVHIIRRCFLAGIDISKVSLISDLFSDGHFAVPKTRSSLQAFIPYVLKDEKSRIKYVLEQLKYLFL
jgi:hypothetical protein